MDKNNYGFIFNNIIIENNIFKKSSKNKLGELKIKNEIEFYLYIKNNNIAFPMPKLLDYSNNEIILEYIKNSETLTNKINNKNVDFYINYIMNFMNKIHIIHKPITSNILKKDLEIEIKNKVLDRFNEYDWENNSIYKSIQYVNNIKIKNINYYCDIIYKKLHTYLDERNYYNLIHGDIHLGNILIDSSCNILFIDPRGFFGETKLFGLKEYDYAKLLFGLSSYSFFDNLHIDELVIKENNIEIDFIKKYEVIFETKLFDNITKLLCLSIWLGNNSCFIDINKKITSLMIAYYYCEKYIEYF
jgi:hypothetical protein